MPDFRAESGDRPFQEKLLMEGMSKLGARELAPLARSWLQAPEIESLSDCRDQRYDPSQRAYVLSATGAAPSFRIAATAERPIVNPCFVVRNWNCEDNARLEINSAAQVWRAELPPRHRARSERKAVARRLVAAGSHGVGHLHRARRPAGGFLRQTGGRKRQRVCSQAEFKESMKVEISLLALLAAALPAAASTNDLLVGWHFDEGTGGATVETVSGRSDRFFGHLMFDQGVRGSGLKFDGFTSRLSRPAKDLPKFGPALTVEAWIAPQEYSWNWTGIVDQETNHQEGFSFGINHVGQVGLGLAIDGQWQTVIPTQAIPLLKWSHVAATYDPAGVMSVFINGQLAGSRNVTGNFSPSREDLWIGTSHTKQWPALTEREVSKTPTPMVFDGLIDEVKLYREALDSSAVMAAFQSCGAEESSAPAIPQDALRSGRTGVLRGLLRAAALLRRVGPPMARRRSSRHRGPVR